MVFRIFGLLWQWWIHTFNMKYTAVVVQHNHQSWEGLSDSTTVCRRNLFSQFLPTFHHWSWLANTPQSVGIGDYFCSAGSLLADTTPWFMDTSYINPFFSHGSRYERTVHTTQYSSISWMLISQFLQAHCKSGGIKKKEYLKSQN